MQSGEGDFLQGFTALLTDAKLRCDFAQNPARIAAQLCADDEAIAHLAALRPEDLHYQAEVLLKKRYAAIRRYLPPNLAEHPTCSWVKFRSYIETAQRRASEASPWMDSYCFLKFVVDTEQVDFQRELNRLEFLAHRKRLSVKLLWQAQRARVKFPALQMLIGQGNGCRDIVIGLHLRQGSS